MLIDKISAGCGITAKLGIEDVALQACNAGSSSGGSPRAASFCVHSSVCSSWAAPRVSTAVASRSIASCLLTPGYVLF